MGNIIVNTTGAFQGEGAVTGTCTFSGGNVTGVQMRAFTYPYGS